MKFKVGDIIRFTGEGFIPFLYGNDHIVIKVEENLIETKGYGWGYKYGGWEYDSATTRKDNWDKVIIVNRKSWSDNVLKFNFINTDVEPLK